MKKRKKEENNINIINNVNINIIINNIKKWANEKPNELLSKKFEIHNDEDKYLVHLEEAQELENLIIEHNNNSSDEDDEEEETFPFRVIDDVQKKGDSMDKYNNRYLQIDSVKGI